jgi:hypothetical protein
MCAAVNTGTVCLYGIGAGQEASLFVQSYSVSSGFNNVGTVVDETGRTITARYDDRRSEIPGGSASVSFSGIITKVDDRGSSKGFVTVSLTAESFEEITY